MKVRIVLMRPAEPMNVGAAARAMKNCDLEDLVLVAPRTDDFVTARRVAVHAQDLLAAPRVVQTLPEAVADCRFVVGTSSRRLAGRTPLTPREVAEQARDSGDVALVFGGEESGLSNDDLVRCHATSCIPSGLVQPSFNLAQAVMIYAYELFQARPRAVAEPPNRASERELSLVEAALREVLVAAGFADPDRTRHGVLDLLQPLRRAGSTPEEARLWLAALKTVLRALRPRS